MPRGYLPGGCTCPGVGVTCPAGVPARGWGLPAQGGTCPGGVPAQVPLTHEQNDRQVQKYYLALNFVCGR